MIFTNCKHGIHCCGGHQIHVSVQWCCINDNCLRCRQAGRSPSCQSEAFQHDTRGQAVSNMAHQAVFLYTYTPQNCYHTLQGKSHLCIPLGIAWPQSQFLHSCVCERFIYSQDRSTYFPAAEKAD
jgi:hypothetical protein